jgi:[ribosomal protein S5]-alanine N-acetyltransferase
VIVFRTERLEARRLTPEDAADCALVYGDAEVTRYVTSGGVTISDVEILRAQIADGMLSSDPEGRFGVWGLRSRSDDELLGTVALIEVEDTPGEYEIGWHLRPSAWGHGYAFESGLALIAHAFDTADLTRVFALARLGNERSIRACSRLQMTRLPDRLYGGDPHAVFVAERGTWRAPEVASGA